MKILSSKNANGSKKGNEYWYNELNQQVQKKTDDKDIYTNTFDKRGNLVETVYRQNQNHSYVVESYVYDATNRMVKGTNAEGEESHYIYNGLGYLIANEWIIKINNYGYTGVNVPPSEQVDGVVVCDRHTNTTGQGHINPTGKGHTTGGTTGAVPAPINSKSFQVVHKDYALDYTSPLKNVITEYESGSGGLTYRYVYGLEKLNAVIYGIPNGVGSVAQSYSYPEVGKASVVKLWYCQDRLGSTAYLTDNVQGKVTSFVSYDDWGAPTMKAILRLGQRELDLVTQYTVHPYDQALNLYFAQARMYDAADRRFLAADRIQGIVESATSLTKYIYTRNNPIKYIDLTGMFLRGTVLEKGSQGENVTLLTNALLSIGINSDTWSPLPNLFDTATQEMVEKYINGRVGVDRAYDAYLTYYSSIGYYKVDQFVWKSLGLPVNSTLEEEFWSGQKGNSTISVSISGNTINIEYFPKFYVQEEYTAWRDVRRPNGSTVRIPETKIQTASQTDYDAYTKRIIAGFEMWANSYYVQGTNVTVNVSVTPTQVTSKKDADVIVTTNKEVASMVPTTIGWSTSKIPEIDFNFGWGLFSRTDFDNVANNAAHEFGHVLGIFDAYGYSSHWGAYGFGWLADIWLPEARPSRAPEYGVMRSPYNVKSAVFTGTEIEMLLYAWSRNELQLYEDSVLGSTSQAFFN